MPIYEYLCPECGVFEEMQKVSDAPLTRCPRGHAGVERKMSASGFILKGSGWYVTDYARKGNGAGAKDGASGAPSEKKGEAKESGSAKEKATSPAGSTP